MNQYYWRTSETFDRVVYYEVYRKILGIKFVVWSSLWWNSKPGSYIVNDRIAAIRITKWLNR